MFHSHFCESKFSLWKNPLWICKRTLLHSNINRISNVVGCYWTDVICLFFPYYEEQVFKMLATLSYDHNIYEQVSEACYMKSSYILVLNILTQETHSEKKYFPSFFAIFTCTFWSQSEDIVYHFVVTSWYCQKTDFMH